MRISDWSSDVCSSDLPGCAERASSDGFSRPLRRARRLSLARRQARCHKTALMTSSNGTSAFEGYRPRPLLGIEGLTASEILFLLDRSDGYVALNRSAANKKDLLDGSRSENRRVGKEWCRT